MLENFEYQKALSLLIKTCRKSKKVNRVILHHKKISQFNHINKTIYVNINTVCPKNLIVLLHEVAHAKTTIYKKDDTRKAEYKAHVWSWKFMEDNALRLLQEEYIEYLTCVLNLPDPDSSQAAYDFMIKKHFKIKKIKGKLWPS